MKPTPWFSTVLLSLLLCVGAAGCAAGPSTSEANNAPDVQASSSSDTVITVDADRAPVEDTSSPEEVTPRRDGPLADADVTQEREGDASPVDPSPEDVVEPPEVADSGPSAWEQAAGLFGLDEVHDVAITLSSDQLKSLSEVPDAWVYTQVTVDGEAMDDVGLRLHGQLGAFRGLDHSAGLSLSFEAISKGHTLRGLKTLSLNNLLHDPSLVRELLTYALFRAAGIPAPRVGYTQVEVNGLPYGVYLMVEPSHSDAFLSHWFDGEISGALYGGRDGQDLFVDAVANFSSGAGADAHKLSLFGLVQALDWVDLSGDVPAQLDAIFGLQGYLDFVATELILGHQDGYAWSRNGYNLYRPTLTSPWAFMPVGADRTFIDHLQPLEGSGRVHQLCIRDPACRLLLGEAYDAALVRIDEIDLVGMAQSAHLLLADAILDDPRPALAPDAVSAALEAVLAYLSERPTTLVDGLVCLDPDYGDEDGDGISSCFGEDCQDDDPLVYPGAPEVCNFADDDCDGEIDETAEGEESCPTCEAIHEDVNGTVLLCRIVANYADAHEACLSRGGDLLSIHSQEEQELIGQAAYASYKGHLWIGINDRIEEGTFAWTDGSPVDFEHWNNNEPNDWGSGEDCGHLYEGNDNRWNDLPCGHEAGYLCRLPNLDLP
ncbi:MAG: lectin-like protein [Myxococcota bacterium]